MFEEPTSTLLRVDHFSNPDLLKDGLESILSYVLDHPFEGFNLRLKHKSCSILFNPRSL